MTEGWGRLHRREFMTMAGGAVLAAAVGCGSGGGSGRGGGGSGSAGTAASGAAAPGTTAAFDPAVPWWLQGGFAPVVDEVESFDLEVTGALPPELTGLYVRNGSNPRTGESPHWFLGDGMVHGVRLDGGRATWYRNRYVRTPMYEASTTFGAFDGPPGGTTTQSNVSAIRFGDRLLSSGEIGFPFELAPGDLSTVGPVDFGGRLTTSMTAHPKLDPDTGRLHFFGYGFVPPYLTYHVLEPDGTLSSSTEVPVPGPTMIHDFAITTDDVVFWDLPVVFDLDVAIAMVETGDGSQFPFRWDPSYGARVGVLPLGGTGADVRWSDLDEPCYVFHGVNAFRRGDEVVLDVCRLDSIFEDGQTLGGDLSLRRWTVPVAGGRVGDEVLVPSGDDPGELPSRDLRRTGREHRHGYLVQNRPSDVTVDMGGVIKHDFRTGRRTVWDPGPTRHSGEWLFVADPGGDADDEGWLLAVIHDEATARSALAVLDATDVAAGPVATVATPQRVPYGFHAAWLPG